MFREEAKQKLKAVCQTLGNSGLGITVVRAKYSGEGDNGSIEDVTAAGGEFEEDEIDLPDGVDADEIADCFEAFLDDGWEINEGEHGEFTLHVTTGELQVERYVRSVQHDTHTL